MKILKGGNSESERNPESEMLEWCAWETGSAGGPTCSQTLGFRVKWLSTTFFRDPKQKKTHVPHAQGKPKVHILLIPLGQKSNAIFRRQVQDNLNRVSCSPEEAGSYWMFCEHLRAIETQHRAIDLRRPAAGPGRTEQWSTCISGWKLDENKNDDGIQDQTLPPSIDDLILDKPLKKSDTSPENVGQIQIDQ